MTESDDETTTPKTHRPHRTPNDSPYNSDGESKEKGKRHSLTKSEQKFGYCKFMDLMNKKSKSASFEEWQLLSEDTKQRTQAFKHFMKRYRVDLFSQLAARADRHEELEEAILENKISSLQAQEMRADLAKRESAYLRRRRSRIKIKDFQLLSLIGRGGYGEVYLCRKLDTKDILVLKRIKKSMFQLNKNELPRVQRERTILSGAQSPWIIKLKYSFQDDTFLYLVMEYAAGGDIKTLLENLGALDEGMAKFYFAEMFLCVEYLHSLEFIHRDLKPGNFVIDKTGHLKLIDFGLSKAGLNNRCGDSFQTWNTMRATPPFKSATQTKDRSNSTTARNSLTKKKRWGLAHSVVGSPEYMAPEMLTGEGYDHSVDIWALGCCLYEMLAGQTPFAADDATAVFSNVINWQDTVQKPEEMSDLAFDLIKKMLCGVEERWSMKELKAHPFLVGIDWATIRQQKSPFVPHLEDEIDTSYFSVDHNVDVDAESLDSNFNTLLESDPHLQMYFAGFTYKRFDG